MKIKPTRGKVLVKRDPIAERYDSDLDLEIHPDYQAQTWSGEVLAVGPAAYIERTVSDGQDENGIPRCRTRVKVRDGYALTVGQELRKGDRAHFPLAAEGMLGFQSGGERYALVPASQVLYAERA